MMKLGKRVRVYCPCRHDKAKFLARMAAKEGWDIHGCDNEEKTKAVYCYDEGQLLTFQLDDCFSDYTQISFEEFVKLIVSFSPNVPYTEYTIDCSSKETSDLLLRLIKDNNRKINRPGGANFEKHFEKHFEYNFVFGFLKDGTVHLWCKKLGNNYVSLEEGIRRLLSENTIKPNK